MPVRRRRSTVVKRKKQPTRTSFTKVNRTTGQVVKGKTTPVRKRNSKPGSSATTRKTTKRVPLKKVPRRKTPGSSATTRKTNKRVPLKKVKVPRRKTRRKR